MRPLVNVLLALGLVAGGIYWAVCLWLYVAALNPRVLLGPAFAILIGCAWAYDSYRDLAAARKR